MFNLNELIFKKQPDVKKKNLLIQEELWKMVAINTEKEMAPHPSTLAWKIPCIFLATVGLLRVGHNSATSLSLFTFMHLRRKWQPTPVFLPRESQGRQSLVGFCL